MKRVTTIARQYALAFLRQGGNHSDLTVLRALEQAFADDARLVRYCESPQIAAADKEALLRKSLGSKGSSLVGALLRVLLQRRKIALLPWIVEQFQIALDDQKGLLTVDVISEKDLSEDQRKRLSAIMATNLGSELRVNYSTDASILGGFIVRSKNLVLDESARGRISALRDILFSHL